MTVRANKPAFNIREKLKELTHSIGLKGRELMRAATVQEARDLVSAGRKNIIINGDMRIAQRGTSASGTGSTFNPVAVDKFAPGAANGPFSTYDFTQESDAPEGFNYSFKVDATSPQTITSGYQRVGYAVEGYDFAQSAYGTSKAKTMTLSFWVKSNVPGNYSVSFSNSSSRQYSTVYTINQSGVWEKKYITLPGDPGSTTNNITNGIGIFIAFALRVASDFSSTDKTYEWVDSDDTARHFGHTVDVGANIGDTWQITGVQLEVGKNATEFEYRPYGEELALCQRYYYKISSVGNPAGAYAMGFAYDANTALLTIPFPVEMRILPSSMDQSGTASDYRILQNGTTTTCDQVPSISDSTKTNATVNMFDTGGYTQGQGLMGRWNSGENGYLGFSAEF